MNGINVEFAKYYDTWHRHIIPLADFLIPIDEAIDRFGLLHYSGDENPLEVQKVFQTLREEYAQKKASLKYEIRQMALNTKSMALQEELDGL